jgi:flagellar basal-body rod protein FlgF
MYVGMAAAAARAAQIDSIADNLANAETPGFKAARPAFASFMPVGAGSDGKAADKVFAGATATGTDMRPGVTVPTDNPLDLVPGESDHFFGVETSEGQIAYTRNGQIQVSPDGELVVAGQLLLNRGGSPISVPAGSSPIINARGEISVDGAVVDGVGLFRIAGPVDRVGRSLLTPSAGSTVENIEGTVKVGELELGNAPALESTVQLISAQRSFESALQAIQTYRKLDEKASEVGRVR